MFDELRRRQPDQQSQGVLCTESCAVDESLGRRAVAGVSGTGYGLGHLWLG